MRHCLDKRPLIIEMVAIAGAGKTTLAKSCANVWTAALDLILWLDAPNELVLERVLAGDE